MSRKPAPKPRNAQSPDQLMRSLAKSMEQCATAEQLNDNVITPFVSALETVCAARGYVLNIYGDKSNIVFTNEADAPVIYGLVEDYLDAVETDTD
ncbi:MAG: hypothetical protein HQ483_05685 [Rhodospirillales bacterium]|nr:hypothetical protein [Rhodospirillales bacterium]